MKKVILAALLLSTTAGFAADLTPLKAPVRTRAVTFDPNPTGLYFGLGASATVANTEFTGTFPAGTFGAGAGLDFMAGYILSADPVTGQFKAIEAGATWRNANATAICDPIVMGPCDAQSRYSLWQGIKLGGPLSMLTAYLPGGQSVFPGITVPQPVSPTTHPYLWLGVHEDFVRAEIAGTSASKIAVNPYLGVGVLQQLSPSQVSDTRLECTPPMGSLSVGFGTVKAGWTCMARQAIQF